jgi:hypothetical protein
MFDGDLLIQFPDQIESALYAIDLDLSPRHAFG